MPAEFSTMGSAAVLLDTHALLWWRSDGERLSVTAHDAITDSPAVLISPVSFWEVAMLVDKRRVRLDRRTSVWARDVLTEERVEIAELSPRVAVAAAELPDFHGDPADRFLYATARALRVTLISKDTRIREYSDSDPRTTVLW